MGIFDDGHDTATGKEPEIGDDTFAQLVVMGFLIGIPATFLVMFAGLLLTTGLTAAAPAIAWASLVGGAYFGGFVALSVHLAGLENRERPVAPQAQSAGGHTARAAA